MIRQMGDMFFIHVTDLDIMDRTGDSLLCSCPLCACRGRARLKTLVIDRRSATGRCRRCGAVFVAGGMHATRNGGKDDFCSVGDIITNEILKYKIRKK